MPDVDPSTITNPVARQAFDLYYAQRSIVRGCFERIPEDSFDFRLVDTPERRSDSPRESLVHVIATQRVYLDAMQRGRLEFGGADHGLANLGREESIVELDATDAQLVALLASADFHADAPVSAPWGQMRAIDMVFSMRDHEILHVGWNLAIMDSLGIERFDELQRFWG